MKGAQKSIPKIPDGMVELMKNLVKSVLKEQPENIYLFAAEYFENLVLKRDGSLDKEYSVFRKYEEELERRRDKEGCSRCRRLVNVDDNGDNDSPKQAEDEENALDMSVSGVAIKAVPRHKALKSQKSKQQLETIRSESMDSAIEDDGKSISAKSHEKIDANVQKMSLECTDTLQKSTQNRSAAASLEPTNDVHEEQIIQPLVEEIIEPISARQLMNEEDVMPDTPTNETSLSDANTDRTVIENAVSTLTIDNQYDDLNPLEIDTEQNNATDNKPTDTSTEFQVLAESPKSEQLNLQKSDRIRTPESDSGLSEKSFNLNIHEETTAHETYKAEPIKEEDFTEEEVIPLNTYRGTKMDRGEEKKMDDAQMNRSDVVQLVSDPTENKQIQSDEKENEFIEDRKKEIERVSSSEEQKPKNDQHSADPQEMIADGISEQVEDPNNIVPKEDDLNKTKLIGSASSEKHENLQMATEKNSKDEEQAGSDDLENKKIEEQPNSTEKCKTIENDQTTDSTEKPMMPVEHKADKPISPNEETDSSPEEIINVIEEHAELPKTAEIEKTIELNEHKPEDAISENETSDINENRIEESGNTSENMKINKSTEERPTEFVGTTDTQPIVDESTENSNEKTENNSDGVETAVSNEKESKIAESTLNYIESSKVIDDMERKNVLSGEESGETIHNDIAPLNDRPKSEDQVDSKWGTTADAIAQKVQEHDGNQVELHKTSLTEDQSPESIQDPSQDIEATDCIELKPDQPSEEADTINKTTDSPIGDENIDEKDEPLKKNSVNNEINDPITELMSNAENEGTENGVEPLKLDSEETIISNELKDVEKDINEIPETNAPKKGEFSAIETEAEENYLKELNGSPKTPKVQSSESGLETDEQVQSKSPPTSPRDQINESSLEIGEKNSEQIDSLPATPKADNNKSETVEQLQSKRTPSSPNTEINSTAPTLDTECETHSIKAETNISIKTKTTKDPEINVNEIESRPSEIKNDIDDAFSEKSSSVKDDLYEKAETEIIGDESVQDLDLSMQDNEHTEEISKEDLTIPNTAKQQTDSPQQPEPYKNDNNQIQPDSLDNSLEPMGENDSLVDTKSVDSLEVEKKDAKSDKFDATTSSLKPNEENTALAQIDQGSVQNKSAKTYDKEKANDKNAVTRTSLVESKPGSSLQELMGDSVNDKGNNDHMNDQMKNELATLNFNRNVTPVQLSNIEEVDTPVTPKPASSEIKFVYESEVKRQDDVKLNKLRNENKGVPHIKIETVVHSETKSLDGEVILQSQHENPEHPNNSTNKPDTKTPNNVKTIDYLTKLRHISHDMPSSDLSDTDTEKPELVSNESCIDENSRDEHDDVSEVENFDLSSCGEDSLEAMYYMLRKNEILMDEQKKMSKCEDEKITFPEKATENLENVFREVSGKKTICSVGSMNSSTDDVILKQLSSDSDALQMHILPNSEIDSSTEPKSCAMNTTDDEYLTEKNDTSSHGMINDETDSKMMQTNISVTIDEQPSNECDTFDDDVILANIERKIQAYSISEADSDEAPANTQFLTKDDFNVSTALGNLRSTTEETDSFESAATKIQAGARGFLTRRRLGRSEADASASIEKRSSIGNAAIDKSLDNFVDRQELMLDQDTSKIENGNLRPVLCIDQTIESIDEDASIQGIIEVKMEQKKNEPNTSIFINENTTENPTLTEVELNETGCDDFGTAQRRLTLQRGDAMQRNSTPELDKEKIDNREATGNEAPARPRQDEATKSIHKSINSASKLSTGKPVKCLGPRQRSMPVQFDSMLMRILPIPERKRIKSANTSTPKKTNRKPNLF